MDIFGFGFGITTLAWAMTWVLLSVAVPVAWLWMLIDALLREEWEYPGSTATSSNRLLWVLLIAFVQIAAIPYYVIVYSKIRRGTVPRPAPVTPATA
jgi:hypothetical protein